VQLGLLIHTALAAAGLSVVIAGSPWLLNTVGLVGAGYLAWLGVSSLGDEGPLALEAAAPRAIGRAVRAAALTNLFNPKVIMLFVALYPNFITLDRAPLAAQLALLSGVLIAINVAWQAGLALAADAARRVLLRPAARRALRVGSGAALLVFALVLLAGRLAAIVGQAP
jgi:threonine/homoserine/homoserine lactone efflux protein